MSAIEEVKQRIDIVEVIGGYVSLTKAGRNMRSVCPFHQEKTPSFFVFPERQSWHCFGACNTGGDVFSFLMKKEGIDFGEALRRLAERAGVALPSRVELDSRKETKDRLFLANEAAARYFHDLLTGAPDAQKARAYLEGRGLNGNAVAQFKLGYARDSWDGLKTHLEERGFEQAELVEAGLLSVSENGRTYDRWRNRIMFPIADDRGRITGFGARVLEPVAEGPKYINTPQTPVFDKSGTLYGLDIAASPIRKQDLAVIVEGYMDVIAAHQYGFDNVIASMGTSITDKQIGILKKMSRNVVLALDPDSAGSEAMLRCVDYENTLEAEIKVIVLPEGKDPDDVIKANADAWRGLVNNAIPVMDFTFDNVSARLDLTKVSDRSAACDRLYPIVNGITDIVRRAHYLQKLARIAGVTDASLEASMQKKGASVRRKTAKQQELIQPTNTVSIFRNITEEYCLALLLQQPQLRERGKSLPAEYFENSENREIFLVWRNCENNSAEMVKDRIDAAIQEHFGRVISRSIPPIGIDQKYADCVLRLREKFLRNLEKKREAILASDGDTAGELAKSKEVSIQLKEVFDMKARKEQGLRSQ